MGPRSLLRLFVKDAARLISASWINSNVSLFDVSDDALLVDYKRRPRRVTAILVVDAVVLDDFAFPITEQRKGRADVLGESLVGDETVHTDPKNLCFRGFEFCDISLIRF
jgi:hypothetical protein